MNNKPRLVPEMSELQKARSEERRRESVGQFAKTKSAIERTYESKIDKLEGSSQFAMLKSMLI